MDFVEKAILKHGNKYDYKAVEYKNCRTKVKIICKVHGEFFQSPSKHLAGQGCPKCAGNFKNTREDFIKKARLKHGDKYDYSMVEYINCDTDVVIICPIHGEVTQTPYAHLNSCGCVECSKILAYENRRKYDLDSFISRSIRVHGDKYNYGEVDYVNERIKVKIICPTHGPFHQSPSEHINRGQGCKLCGYGRMSVGLRHTKDSFICEANKRHNNKYDYSKVIYNGYLEKIEIICPTHGSFYQFPRDHINYCGCPKCGSECIVSKGHQELVDFLKEYSISVVINDRSVIEPYEIDILVPSKKLCIEFNGIYWHSYCNKESRDDILRHVKKLDMCASKGFELINIFEDKWNNNKEIIKSFLLNKLGLTRYKVYARKCNVKIISNNEFRDFTSCNHIDGSIPTNIKYGLFNKNKLVMVMGFNKHYYYGWEISRLSTLINHVVVGGASKIFSKFISDFNPNTVMTYANRSYSCGLVYYKLGFKLIKITKPNYKYIKNNNVYSRQKFQKHKLKNKLDNFDESLSESENMFNNGFRRIWDCGNFKFLWSK